MTDEPMLPMPGLEQPPLRRFEVAWHMSGRLVIFATSEAVARADARKLRQMSLPVTSDHIDSIEMSEPKEVAGE